MVLVKLWRKYGKKHKRKKYVSDKEKILLSLNEWSITKTRYADGVIWTSWTAGKEANRQMHPISQSHNFFSEQQLRLSHSKQCHKGYGRAHKIYVWHYYINSSGSSDAVWQHRSGSTLAQVIAYCYVEPRRCLNRYWLITNKFQWHSADTKLLGSLQHINS